MGYEVELRHRCWMNITPGQTFIEHLATGTPLQPAYLGIGKQEQSKDKLQTSNERLAMVEVLSSNVVVVLEQGGAWVRGLRSYWMALPTPHISKDSLALPHL